MKKLDNPKENDDDGLKDNDRENDQIIWKIINTYFKDKPNYLVRHHLDSYNDFFKQGIYQLFREKNPLTFNSIFDSQNEVYRHQCILHFGGESGDKLYFGKPTINDEGRHHYMYPNEARLRDMTYAMPIHYDIDITFIDYLEEGEDFKLPFLEENLVEIDGTLQKLDVNMKYTSTTHKGGYSGLQVSGDPDFEEQHREIVNKRRPSFKLSGKEERQEGGKEREKTMEEKMDILTGPRPTEGGVLSGGAPKSKTGIPTEDKKIFRRQLRKQIRKTTLPRIYLGKFPIMVQSDLCILSGLTREIRYSLGECKNDQGGYFIINGKEKTVISQEKFADNILYVREYKGADDPFTHSAEIRSVSENVSKPIRTLSVKIMRPTGKFTYENIVVNIPNITKPVPLFIVFRALGVLSDKDIITYCLIDMEKYGSLIELFRPSIHDAGYIFTQRNALYFISQLLLKQRTIPKTMEVLADYFLPHIGETNFKEKAHYLGYMVFRLLSVRTGLEVPTDRDNFKYKRIDTSGLLIAELFREYYTLQQKVIFKKFEEQLKAYHTELLQRNLYKMIFDNKDKIFLENRVVDVGFRRAFKGNWGAEAHTKRIGVIQDLNRLSFNSAMSHMRKTNVPLDASAKVVGPRLLHNSQWGFLDPIDTPDGANIGLHKTLSITAEITKGISREPMIEWLREKVGLQILADCHLETLIGAVKVFVNGYWVGILVGSPTDCIEKIRLFKRNGLLPISISATFDIQNSMITIYTDAGRLTRPILYIEEGNAKKLGELSIWRKKDEILDGKCNWSSLTTGFHTKKRELKGLEFLELGDLYDIGTQSSPTDDKITEKFKQEQAVIEYIDTSESENAMICVNLDTWRKESTGKERKDSSKDSLKYTHVEIHESLMFGALSNLIVFPENNPLARNSFSCGQSRQAVSLYHTNYQNRMDKSAVVLNGGQIPLVKTRYLEMINHEENPYGQNAIVAIMCYTGYNVEDAILINQGALDRGLFRTTYYTTYHTFEEKTKQGNFTVEKTFTNIQADERVIKTKLGFDYGYLDEYGIIKENTPVNDKLIMIGLSSNNTEDRATRIDASVSCKKGQLGIVDKTFITEGEEGKRIAKVRIREERIPAIGDKFASRLGQKGTIGLIIPERDMPFTKDGIRPDLIINPHAIPTRMTIGQLVEAIVGKSALVYGAFGDCTAFNTKGFKVHAYGEHLLKMGYHSSGNEILYNGMTGDQLGMEIFIGPTYYMRLKHMVKDKINYRAGGPITALTRQPVSGRALGGGLRIGEMERDSLLSHGIANFLKESMMERSDKYFVAVCNTTGMLAIYNPSKNIFMSLSADGPVDFTDSLTDANEIRLARITRFGRDFSIVSVPYSFKLLLQELQCMNIQMRIITEDNIKQLENLSFSGDNLKNLLKTGETVELEELIKQANEDVGKRIRTKKGKNRYDDDEDEDEENKTIFPILQKSVKQPLPFIEQPTKGTEEPFLTLLKDGELPPNYTIDPENRRYFGQIQNKYDGYYYSWELKQNPTILQYVFDSNSKYRVVYWNPKKNDFMFADDPSTTLILPEVEQIMYDIEHPSHNYENESRQYSPHSPSNSSPRFSPHSPSDSPPRFSPHSPSDSPPPYIGEKVFLRGGSGDKKADRIWEISNIGDKFLTIRTDDTNDLELDKSIRVVNPMDVFPIEQGFYGNEYQPINNQMNPEMFVPQQYSHQLPPPNEINIKIVNGDNIEKEEKKEESKQVGESGSNSNSNIHISGDDLPIDFSKGLVIKKM